jgi:MYXO-CTERM domain-containing protein
MLSNLRRPTQTTGSAPCPSYGFCSVDGGGILPGDNNDAGFVFTSNDGGNAVSPGSETFGCAANGANDLGAPTAGAAVIGVAVLAFSRRRRRQP